MSFKSLKLRWARKLLRAKYFVVMTDTESAIAFEGVNPNSFTDEIALRAQATELQQFYTQLGTLVGEHEEALKKLTGGNRGKSSNVNRNKKASSK